VGVEKTGIDRLIDNTGAGIDIENYQAKRAGQHGCISSCEVLEPRYASYGSF
jgi:hypothetical protein